MLQQQFGNHWRYVQPSALVPYTVQYTIYMAIHKLLCYIYTLTCLPKGSHVLYVQSSPPLTILSATGDQSSAVTAPV
jgi:hypothetical protein